MKIIIKYHRKNLYQKVYMITEFQLTEIIKKIEMIISKKFNIFQKIVFEIRYFLFLEGSLLKIK